MRKMSFSELERVAKDAGKTRQEYMRDGMIEDVKLVWDRWNEPYSKFTSRVDAAEDVAFCEYHLKINHLFAEIVNLHGKKG